MKTYEVKITRLVTDRLKGSITVEAENEEAALKKALALLEEGADPPMDYDEQTDADPYEAVEAVEVSR